MYHIQRWTLDKIKARLDLIALLVYDKAVELRSFRYKRLDGPLAARRSAPDVDDSQWEQIRVNDYWGAWMSDFVLRTTFTVPPTGTHAADRALSAAGRVGRFQPSRSAGLHRRRALCRLRSPPPGDPSAARPGATAKRTPWPCTAGPGSAACERRPAHEAVHAAVPVVQIDQPRAISSHWRAWRTASPTSLTTLTPPASLLNALDEPSRCSTRASRSATAFYASVAGARRAARRHRQSRPAARRDDLRHRPRPHRCGLAVDAGADAAQGGAHLPHRHAPDGAVPRLPLQPEPGAALRLRPPGQPGAVRGHQAARRRRALGADGRHVGGGRLQSVRRGVAGPPVPAGPQFLREHFGADAESPVLWLPDVFGYAWTLPQLIKQAGLKYFFTIKIGWNQYNRLPYDSFWWQGLDGTRVLTHFSTARAAAPGASTYNAMAHAKQVLGTWSNFQQKELQDDLLMAYGYGDGGGGPTREMLENIGEMGDFPACRRCARRASATSSARWRPLAADRSCPPGTASSTSNTTAAPTPPRPQQARQPQERIPAARRRVPGDAGGACSTPTTPTPPGVHEAWELVCLNQFHDIIPGSSIGPVYDESQQQYAQVTDGSTP